MAETKPDSSPLPLLTDAESKSPNTKEKCAKSIFEDGKSPRHYKETHGRRIDIDENTSIDEVKAPNVFERVKEEFEALVQTIHPKKEMPNRETRDEIDVTGRKEDNPGPHSENKEGSRSNRHHKETHGRSNSIDEKTPIDEVKGPNIFERAKEEIEALVHTIHHKAETDSPRKEGLRSKIGRGLEKVCHPIKKEPNSPGKEGLGSKIGRGLEKVCSPHKDRNHSSQSVA